MNITSTLLLRSAIRLLVQVLEILNRIPEDDFRQIVLLSQKQKKYIKGIRDTAERGNIFMTAFFLRELLERLVNE